MIKSKDKDVFICYQPVQRGRFAMPPYERQFTNRVVHRLQQLHVAEKEEHKQLIYDLIVSGI